MTEDIRPGCANDHDALTRVWEAIPNPRVGPVWEQVAEIVAERDALREELRKAQAQAANLEAERDALKRAWRIAERKWTTAEAELRKAREELDTCKSTIEGTAKEYIDLPKMLDAAAREARAGAFEEIEKIVGGSRCTVQHLGLLWGAGWNECIWGAGWNECISVVLKRVREAAGKSEGAQACDCSCLDCRSGIHHGACSFISCTPTEDAKGEEPR